MPKQVLVNAYTAKNLGDDLFLKILFERYPNTNFLLLAPSYILTISQYKNVELVKFPELSFLDRLILKVDSVFSRRLTIKRQLNYWRQYFQNQLNQIDAYIVLGGSMFMQDPNGGISLNDTINELASNIFEEKPKFIIGSNFGPFFTNEYFNLYKNIFARYTDICFREHYSKSLFASLENVRCCPDVVFQLHISEIEKKSKHVGFSLIDITHRKDLNKYSQIYITAICDLISFYIGKGYSPYLFSFCNAEGDEKIIAAVLNNLPEVIRSKVKPVYYNGNINEFLNIFGSMEIVFSTRFHAMILSMMFQQKIYPIIYSEKMSNVLVDLKYTGKSIKISEMSSLNTQQVFDEVNDSFLFDEELKRKSEDNFLKLDNFLDFKKIKNQIFC